MKKILKTFSLMVALATVFVLGLNTAQAQDAAKPDSTGRSKFMVGVRAGLNVSRIRVNNGAANDFIPGAQAGLFAKYSFNDWVAVSLEAAYSQSGAGKTGYQSSSGSPTMDWYINNIQINPLFNVKLPVLSVYEPYVFVGPSFNINAHEQQFKTGFAEVNNDMASSLDLGLLAGVGVDFNLRFAVLTLDARYRHGLNDINQRTGVAQSQAIGFTGANGGVLPLAPTLRSSQFSFQVGLGFPIGGKK
jgi:opacity protein-like surface antigen